MIVMYLESIDFFVDHIFFKYVTKMTWKFPIMQLEKKFCDMAVQMFGDNSRKTVV